MILEGILVSWHALELEICRFKIFLNISSLATYENEKARCFFSLHTSPIVSMLKFISVF